MTTNRKKEDAAVNMVKKITNQEELAKIALNAPIDNVRSWAVEKLTDQAVLLQIAKNNNYSTLFRGRAVRNLTNQSVLINFAKNDKDHHIRWSAIFNLTEQSVLKYISENDNEEYVRKAAAEKLASIGLYNSDDIESFYTVMEECRFAMDWDKGYKAFNKLQTLCAN